MAASSSSVQNRLPPPQDTFVSCFFPNKGENKQILITHLTEQTRKEMINVVLGRTYNRVLEHSAYHFLFVAAEIDQYARFSFAFRIECEDKFPLVFSFAESGGALAFSAVVLSQDPARTIIHKKVLTWFLEEFLPTLSRVSVSEEHIVKDCTITFFSLFDPLLNYLERKGVPCLLTPKDSHGQIGIEAIAVAVKDLLPKMGKKQVRHRPVEEVSSSDSKRTRNGKEVAEAS